MATELSIRRRASARGSSGPRAPDCRIGEFVAPQPRDRPGVLHAALQPRGHRAKQQIAAGQAECVIHSLELIEIEQKHGGLGPGRAGRASGHAREVLEQGAIGQSGQRIVARLMAYLGLGPLQVRHVEGYGDDLDDAPGLVKQRRLGGQQGMFLG